MHNDRILEAIVESARADSTETIYPEDRESFDLLIEALAEVADDTTVEYRRDGDAVVEGWGEDEEGWTWRVELVLEGGA